MDAFDEGAAQLTRLQKTFSRNNRRLKNTTEDRASQPRRDYVTPRSKVENAIVTMALWGVVPRQIAEALIKFGGLRRD